MSKSLAEFRVRRRESSIIRCLPRHVRGRKHFARSERRIVRFQRTTEAQNAADLSRALRFVRRRACSIPSSFPVVAVEEVPLYAVFFIGYHGVEVDVLHAAEDVRLDLGVRLLHAADKLLHLRPL